ncbi:Hypothetical predicted protein, partial [Pelobates cultripes]
QNLQKSTATHMIDVMNCRYIVHAQGNANIGSVHQETLSGKRPSQKLQGIDVKVRIVWCPMASGHTLAVSTSSVKAGIRVYGKVQLSPEDSLQFHVDKFSPVLLSRVTRYTYEVPLHK